jgi:hypothetical protein
MSMSLQTTYLDTPPVAFQGQLVVGPSLKETVKNADTVSIPFGSPVFYKPSGATSDNDVTLPANSTDILRGFSFRSDGFERAWTDDIGTQGDLDGTGIRTGKLFDIVRVGTLWTVCHTGCVPKDRLFIAFNATGTTYTAVGQLGNVAESGHSIDASTKGEWRTTASADGLARLQIDCINK